MKKQKLFTVGDIAAQHGMKRESVQYAVHRAGIAETARAGNFRLYSKAQAAKIVATALAVRTRA